MNDDYIKIRNQVDERNVITLNNPTCVYGCKYKNVITHSKVYISNTSIEELCVSKSSNAWVDTGVFDGHSKITTVYFYGDAIVGGGHFNKMIIGPYSRVFWNQRFEANKVIVSGVLDLRVDADNVAENINVVLNPGGKLICQISGVEKKLNITTPDGTEPRRNDCWICG